MSKLRWNIFTNTFDEVSASQITSESIKIIDTSTYTLQSTDEILFVDCSLHTVTIYVPEPLDTISDGKRFDIKDYLFNSTINNISITSVSGTVFIDNQNLQSINFDGGSLTLVKYDSAYYII